MPRGDAAEVLLSRAAPAGTIALASVTGVDAARLQALLDASFGCEVARAAPEGPFIAAFDTATDGLRFALDVLRANPEAAIAVHLGEPELVEKAGELPRYSGSTCDRLAAVGAACPPGVLLVTERAWHEGVRARDSLGAPLANDLGELRLAGLEAPEHLFEVRLAEAAGKTLPPPRALDAAKTNLPPPTASFIGREPELAAIAQELAKGARLVTLHGAGGMGRTRLALRFAALALPEYPGGVWLADLAEARTPDGLCSALARALGVSLARAATVPDAISTLGEALAARGRALIVLDECDLVARPLAEMLAAWAASAPEARFLATSAQPLRVPGERTRLLEPLSPRDAMRLLSERAHAVAPDLDDEAARPVWSEIARRVEGIPLALELCAARAADTAPPRLLEWARARFSLASGTREPADHALTVRAAIAAIYDGLEDWDRLGLAQSSVFRGGFSLEAAEDVLDVSRFEDAPAPVDVVQSLWDRGLLRPWEPAGFPGELRFALPAPVLAFAAEQLELFSEGRETTAHHALHYLDAAEDWGADTRRLALELENIASVLQASLGEDPPTAESASDALRAVLALDPLLESAGPLHVRRAWMDAALAIAEKAGGADAEKLAEVRRRRASLPG